MHQRMALIWPEGRIGIPLSEQNALFALQLADRGYILENGRMQHQASAIEPSGRAKVRQDRGIQERGSRRLAPRSNSSAPHPRVRRRCTI